MPNCQLNFGSLTLHLSFERSFYADALAEFFCSPAKPIAEKASKPDVEITFNEPNDRFSRQPGSAVTVPEDGMVIVDAPPAQEVHTEALSIQLFRNESPVRILVAVLSPKMAERHLKVHLAVALFKVFFLLDRLILHAAAVDFRGSVSLFVGGKGAGKSTTALQLARAGGTILAEDRVILHKADGRFFVSGCGEKSRITAKTERHFFSKPLQVEPRDVEGVLKKEFPAGRFFSSMPYRDYPPDRLFFNQVGSRLKITRLSRGAALVGLMRETKTWHRFTDAEDHRRHLSYLGACVEALPAFRLELSQDLTELDHLVAFLRARR
jgi:hypothetical protein